MRPFSPLLRALVAGGASRGPTSRRGHLLTTLALLTVAGPLGAQRSPSCESSPDESSGSLRPALQAAAGHIVQLGALGAVVALEAPCVTRTSVAAGFADRSRVTPLLPSHGFQVASISKIFAAAAVLLLEREGRLSLEDRLADYFDGFIGSREVTLHHVLTHTSGIADGVPAYWATQIFPADIYTLEDVALLSRLHGQQFEPGERFQYNELGIMSLATVVEQVADKTMAQLVRERITDPLGMDDTYFGSEENWPVQSMGRGYHRQPGTGEVIDVNEPQNLTWAMVAGDIVSTADDLLDFAGAILDDESPIGLTLSDFMTDPYVFEHPSTMTRYGHGLAELPLGGQDMWGHLGGIYGYRSLFLMDPDSKTRIVVWLSFSGDADENQTTIYQMGIFQAATAALHRVLGR